jgi:glutathione S-transferase
VKIYDFAKGAPSPRKVRIFLAEKGIAVPYEQVDIHRGESRTPEFKKKNPLGNVPVLELGDGTCISDSVAICRYFEALYPEPRLFGSTPEEQGEIEMWVRRIELNLYLAIDLTAAFAKTVPEAAERCGKAAHWFFGFLDGVLADREFIAGDCYTAPDILALCALDFGTTYVGFELPPQHENLARWYRTVSSRPSTRA